MSSTCKVAGVRQAANEHFCAAMEAVSSAPRSEAMRLARRRHSIVREGLPCAGAHVRRPGGSRSSGLGRIQSSRSLLAKLRTGSSPKFEQFLDKFYYNSVVFLDSRLKRLGEHQLDQVVLHRAGLAAHLCLRLAKWRGARQAANEHGRALYAAEAPAQWLGVALSKAIQWLFAISRLGRGPGSRPLLDKLYYSAVFLAKSRLMRPAGHQLDRLVLH